MQFEAGVVIICYDVMTVGRIEYSVTVSYCSGVDKFLRSVVNRKVDLFS